MKSRALSWSPTSPASSFTISTPDEQLDLPLFARPQVQPHQFTLAEFPQHVRHFAFMLGQTRVRLDPEDPANEKAYDRMCELHDALMTGGFDRPRPRAPPRPHPLLPFCRRHRHLHQPEVFTLFIRTQTREDGSDLGARLNELFDSLEHPSRR